MRNLIFQEVPLEERRFQAVFCLLQGGNSHDVAAKFQLARSDLFKFKRRALEAIRTAMADRQRGPKHAHNRLLENKERRVRAACERHTTLSSYEVQELLGEDAPSARTIQRMRRRLSLPRVPKRNAVQRKRRRLSRLQKMTIKDTVRAKLFLGPLRLTWELRNQHNIIVSPSTVRRVKQKLLARGKPQPKPKSPQPCLRYERKHPHSLWHGDLLEKVTLTDEDVTAFQLTLLDDYSRAYVFCDLFRTISGSTVLAGIVSAMRAYQAIPKAILFDNGAYFRSRLISTFCGRLGIRLIHSRPYHPQTNGKLERAFRDDMNEFYRQRNPWIFDQLQAALPEYVTYRNTLRGHLALDGQPAAERLREQNIFALPALLRSLESYAWCPQGAARVAVGGTVCLYKRVVNLDPALAGTRVSFYESLQGLEAEANCGAVYLLPTTELQTLRYFAPRPWDKEGNRPFQFLRFHGTERRSQYDESHNFSPSIAVAR